MTLDFKTLLVMTLVNFSIAAIAAILVWRANRPVPGLGNVACGITVIGTAFGLAFFGRPLIGNFAPWFGNAAQIAGLFLVLNGTLQFRGFRRRPIWLCMAVSLPSLVGQSYFLFVSDDRTLRALTLAPFMGLLCLASAAVMVYQTRPDERFLHFAIGGALTLYAFMLILRSVALVLPSSRTSTFATVAMPALCLIALNVSVVACLFGLATATNIRLREQIEKLAFCDPLTGLPNRRAFEEHLSRAQAHSSTGGTPLALIYVDLDRFKEINDRFGHAAGDLALQSVAERLRTITRQGDCLARLGGDEFVLLTARFLTRDDAQQLVLHLQDSLKIAIPLRGEPVQIAISCGLAFDPGAPGHAFDLVREADMEMYEQKRRNAREYHELWTLSGNSS